MTRRSELIVSRNIEKTLYFGLATLAVAFFLFYGGPMMGFETPRSIFLGIAIIGFQILTAARILVANRKEIMLLTVMDIAFVAAATSLIIYTDFSFGRWDYFLFMTVLFIAFVTGGLLPVKKVRPRDYGVIGAFIMSFFFEMFGFPLSLYLMNIFLSSNFPMRGREALEAAHLWTTFGLLGDYEAHFFSALLIMIGVALILLGHRTLHAAKGAVVTSGIYRYIKHPQYIGIILVAGGMLVEYPTLPSFAMWLAIIAMYTIKARKESREMGLSRNCQSKPTQFACNS